LFAFLLNDTNSTQQVLELGGEMMKPQSKHFTSSFFALYVLNANKYKKCWNRADCWEYCAPFNRTLGKCNVTVLPQLDEDRRRKWRSQQDCCFSVGVAISFRRERIANSCYWTSPRYNVHCS